MINHSVILIETIYYETSGFNSIKPYQSGLEQHELYFFFIFIFLLYYMILYINIWLKINFCIEWQKIIFFTFIVSAYFFLEKKNRHWWTIILRRRLGRAKWKNKEILFVWTNYYLFGQINYLFGRNSYFFARISYMYLDELRSFRTNKIFVQTKKLFFRTNLLFGGIRNFRNPKFFSSHWFHLIRTCSHLINWAPTKS